MPTKKRSAKKKSAPKKTTKRQKKSAHERVYDEIREPLEAMGQAAIDLRAALPKFKRLSQASRDVLYDWMDGIDTALSEVIDLYYDATEHSTEENSGSVDILPPIIGALGLAGMLSGMLGRASNPEPPQDPEWPDSIDAEYKRIEPENTGR